MTHPQILEIVLGIGLIANGVLFAYEIVRILKRKTALRENDTNIEGVTFKDIVDKIPAHIYWKDLDGRCLGASELQYKNLGLSKKEYIGKTDFELFPKNIAETIVAIDREVLLSGASVVCEESTIHYDGSERYCLSHKIPLRNKENALIALLGVSVDVTDAKRKTLDQLVLLENIISAMPGHVYWMDKDGVYLGCNDNEAKAVGLPSRQDIIGKKNIDIPNFTPPEILDPVNQSVMTSGKARILEEPATYPDGRQAIFLSSKVPLRDIKGQVNGMLGISIDITEKKKAEQYLKEAKEKADAMNASALQVAHDIRSPLAAISMLTKACVEIPEAQRICLREAVDRIHDIANQLLTKHGKVEASIESDVLSPVMVATALLSIISSKRVEYQNLKVKINFEASSEAYFSFILADMTEFKRMVSNLINNAIEARINDHAEVKVTLNKNGPHLIMSVIDDGKGMSEEKVRQILSDEAITTEKEAGFGLGLTHIKKMLKKFNAKLAIYSSSYNGTTMELMFDLIPAPEWMAKSIEINSEDCVIVLDDDQSIHGAWNEIFSETLEKNPTIKLLHFSQANECINYVNSLENTEQLLFLSDYELIGQAMNGLDVIEKTKLRRAILVTSHYEDPDVIKRANMLNTKILPKMLASQVKLTMDSKVSRIRDELLKVDLILLDDCEAIADAVRFSFDNRTLKVYSSPYALLEEIALYHKDTKICTDYTLNCSMTGLDVAKILHEQGFTNLFLATGHDFKQNEMPNYLKVLNSKLEILKL